MDPSILGGLLSLLAHDLRSPLTALQSNLDYVTREASQGGDDAREALIDGLLSCDAFSHLIENCDLLALSLRPQPEPVLGPVAVRDLIDEVTRRCAAAAASYGQSIAIDAPTGLQASSEIEMLARTLGNLVRNSIQHSPQQSSLLVSARDTAEGVEIWVQDRGPKIPEDARESVFTAEGQLSNRLHRGRYSRGLGLYCARVAADRAGVRISVVDRPEANNTFVLQLARWE